MTTNVIERAFELASSGRFRSVDEIASHLAREDFLNVHAHFRGLLIRQQLRARMKRHSASRPRRTHTRKTANDT